MLRIFLLYILFYFMTFNITAQDITFSQFYKNPIYLNPALTALQSCGRLYTNYRQTSFGPLDSKAMSIAFDIPFISTNSGLGGMLQVHEEGLMRTGIFAVQFSKKVSIYKDIFITMGMEAGGIYRDYNLAKMVLPSDVQSYSTAQNTNAPPSLIFDMAAGAGLNYKVHYAGFSVRHITEPAAKSIFVNSQLYRKYTAHYAARLSYNLPGQVSGYIAPQIIFDKQKGNNHLTYGVYGFYNSLGGGIWIRNHFPISISYLIMMGTIKTKNFEFSYSYDFPINGSGIESGGHEVAITYYLPDFKEKYHKLNSKNCLSF